MKTLAFDTSTKYLSIACLEDDTLIAEFHEDVGIRHSELLVPAIKNMMENAGWTVEDVGLFCVGLGPGSFTGLRIAVSTLKGLTLAAPAKAKGVPSIDAMAFNAPPGKRLVAPLLDAHKGKVYSCVYQVSAAGVERITEHLLVTVQDLLGGLKEEVFFFGNGIAKYRKELDSARIARYDEDVDWYPRASRIGLLGIERSKKGFDDPEEMEPLYLHPKECDISEDVMRRIEEKKKSKR